MNKIEKIELINFRCFENHVVRFFAIVSLIVGKNNAGKSTLIEALKIISFAIQKAKSKNYTSANSHFDIPLAYRGIELRFDDIGVDIKNLFFRYETPPPSKIIAYFNSGARAEVYINLDINFTVFFDPKNKNIKSRMEAQKILPDIAVMPQPGPLLQDEMQRDPDYVKKNVSSRRSVLHFRNQLAIFESDFEKFKSLLPTTWKHLSINSLIKPESFNRNKNLSLLVKEDDFVAEVAWMGHGVQVWLQTVWFLCRTSSSAILILDEPDVYLHADLQRKLIRLLLEKNDRQPRGKSSRAGDYRVELPTFVEE
jgi:AAA15 family ATPase/GTPase